MGRKLQELESLRGFAAVYVFLHHLGLAPDAGFGRLLHFGQEAVILFFLLSGFVIYYATSSSNRERVPVSTYLIHRTRRIFPLLLVALAAAYFATALNAGGLPDPRWRNLLENLLMTQDVARLKRGVFADTYYGDTALWSLSYEWWFYMLFIPLELLRPIGIRLRIGIVVAVAIGGVVTYQWHPNQASLFAGYFIIWWLGVEAAREYRERATVTLDRQWLMYGGLLLCALFWTLPVILDIVAGVHLSPGLDPVLQARHFLAAEVIVGIAFLWRHAGLRCFRYTLGPFRVLAPISYSIYLLHIPVLVALDHWRFTSPILRAITAFLILVPVGYLLEVKLQRAINRWSDRMMDRHSGRTLRLVDAAPRGQAPLEYPRG